MSQRPTDGFKNGESLEKDWIPMQYPKSVYELLDLLKKRDDWMPVAEIPDRLQNALDICRGEHLLVRVASVGPLGAPPIAYLQKQGRAELALHDESGCDWSKAQLPQNQAPQPSSSCDPPDNYADFRIGPGGPFLTAELCWEMFGVSNSVLSKTAKNNPNIRRKNPDGGSGFVYRYDVVSLVSNRKSERD
jgi:hypothetical protein